MNNLRDFYQGYLWGYLLMISFPIGALGVRLVHVLTGGAWGVPLRKYYTMATRTWAVSLLLAVPLIFGFTDLYAWAAQNNVYGEEKRFYLNVPFFAVRNLFYFGIWFFSSVWLDRFNQRHNIAGGLALLYVLAGSFAGIDWVMSLDPYWYSTIFGFVFIMGQVLLAFCVLVCLYIFREKPSNTPENMGRLRDQGNLILTMVMLWAYVAFSQYLIIWMGNVPEEIHWYLNRIKAGWGVLGAGLIAGHFFVPFFLLLRRAWKEDRHSLSSIALWILAMRILDMGWMVFPGLHKELFQINAIHVISAMVPMIIYSFVFWRRIKSL